MIHDVSFGIAQTWHSCNGCYVVLWGNANRQRCVYLKCLLVPLTGWGVPQGGILLWSLVRGQLLPHLDCQNQLNSQPLPQRKAKQLQLKKEQGALGLTHHRLNPDFNRWGLKESSEADSVISWGREGGGNSKKASPPTFNTWGACEGRLFPFCKHCFVFSSNDMKHCF